MHVDMNRVDSETMEYLFVSVTRGNETSELAWNGTNATDNVPFSFTVLFATTLTSRKEQLGDSPAKSEFQYYIIGVYSFFALLFSIGILMIVGRKLQKACCPKKANKYRRTDSESSFDHPDHHHPQEEGLLNSQYSPVVIEHHVDIGSSGAGRTQEHDSDYEYYSESSEGGGSNDRDKPPEYDHPPAYSIVLQN